MKTIKWILVMNLCGLLAALAAEPPAAPAPVDRSGVLLPVMGKNGKYGYVDTNGRGVIKPAFDEPGPVFIHDVAPVLSGGKFGLIDRTGAFVVQPQYDLMGCARAKCCDMFTGMLANSFGDDYTIDAEIAKAPAVFYMGSMEPKGIQYGFMDGAGNILLDPEDMTPLKPPQPPPHFSPEGLAIIQKADGYRNIDATGKVVQGPTKIAAYFSEGYFTVWKKSAFRFVDRNGNAIPGTYRFAGGFSEGLATVEVEGKGLWGAINTNGEFVIPATFNSLVHFQNGLSKASWDKGAKQGFVDRTGKVIAEFDIPDAFTVRPFSQGLAAIYRRSMSNLRWQENGWVYVDMTGKTVIRLPDAGAAYSFFEDGRHPCAVVITETGMGMIDKTGAWVLEPKYMILPFAGDVTMAFYKSQEGGALARQFLLNRSGQVVKEFPVP